MNLSSELISQFVKITNDTKAPVKESTVYGTIVEYEGSKYVKLDGSELLTPMTATTDTVVGERVTVLIKDHTATVTGNVSSPAARTDDVQDIGNKISEFEIVIADKVSTKELEAERARIDELVTDNVTIRGELTANTADIREIEADNVEINKKLTAQEADISNLETTKLSADIADLKYASIGEMDAVEADIYNLRATYGEFSSVTTDDITALKASVKDLDTNKLSAKDAKIQYANIDFANIGEAAIKRIFSDYGLIKDLVVGDGTITGELVGVTLKGDLIEGNTIKADKLVVKGSDGLYYKLNFEGGTFKDGEVVPTDSLHGSVITAKSITAEKVSVKDLVAFGATIGGFKITETSLYSGVKESIDNTTRGVYQDSNGQFAVGDATNFLKFYEAEDGSYKLAISADLITISSSGQHVATSEDVSHVQESADEAKEKADTNAEKLISSDAKLQVLENAISSLVRDGDTGSLIKQDSDGLYYFDISSIENTLSNTANGLNDLEGIVLDANGRIDVLNSSVTALISVTEYIRSYTNDLDQPCLELGDESSFKLLITNTDMQFKDGDATPASISNKKLNIETAQVRGELQVGNDQDNSQEGMFVWKVRSNGNLGLAWRPKGVTS